MRNDLVMRLRREGDGEGKNGEERQKGKRESVRRKGEDTGNWGEG